MNVLIAANYATPQSGNFIASLFELGNALRAQGDALFFIFPACPNTQNDHSWVNWLKENHYPVHLVDRSASEKLQLNELKQIIALHHIDILHTHFSIYQSIILKHRNQLPVKIVVHDHSGFLADRPMWRQRAHNLILSAQYRMKRIGAVNVSSAIDASLLFARHWHVPNGLSLKRYITKSRSREECRAEFGFHQEHKVCLFLGWALHLKGLDIACKAIQKCREKDSSIELAIVGVGNPPTKRAKEYIRSQTGIDPNSPWIHYLPDTEDMFAYHRMADVYLSASRSEGFSYGILETISQNTPVALSDLQSTSWAWEYDHAFHYPVENAQACADAILAALSAGKTASNFKAVFQKYHIHFWCERIIDIYRSL